MTDHRRPPVPPSAPEFAPPSVESPVGPVEVPCPNCGEPMIAGWGSTCGRCRPNLVAPKTLFLFAPNLNIAVPAPATGMSLGWLVILRSPDPAQRGTLIELGEPVTVLSRAGSGSSAYKQVEIQDEFMSSAHATVRRPAEGDPNGAFTIRDREDPGPSANGTFVNSHKLGRGEEVRLSDGDTIRLGTTELLFKSLWLPPADPGR